MNFTKTWLGRFWDQQLDFSWISRTVEYLGGLGGKQLSPVIGHVLAS